MKFLITLFRLKELAEPALMMNMIQHADTLGKIDGAEINADLEDPLEVQRLFEYGHFLKQHGKILQLHAPLSLNKHHNNDVVLKQHMAIYGKLAKELGKSLPLTLHPVDHENPLEAQKLTEKFVKKLLQICETNQYDITFALENMNLNTVRLDTAGVMPVVDKTQVGFCWDIGHEVSENKCNYALDNFLIKKLENVHIHDIHTSDHFPFRYGNTDYVKSLKYLNSIHYTDTVVVEISIDYLSGDNWTDKYADYVSQIYLLADAYDQIRFEDDRAV